LAAHVDQEIIAGVSWAVLRGREIVDYLGSAVP
jgi:hypothetical protein